MEITSNKIRDSALDRRFQKLSNNDTACNAIREVLK